MTSELHPRLQSLVARARRSDGGIDMNALLAAVSADFVAADRARAATTTEHAATRNGHRAKGTAAGSAGMAEPATILHSFDDARAAFAIYDAQERLTICNDYFRQLLFDFAPDLPQPGIRFQELCEAHARHHLGPANEDTVRKRVATRLQSFRNPTGIFERQLADGRWVMSSERRTQDGGTVSINLDITDRKNAENALRASEMRLRAIIENAPLGIGLSRIADRRLLYTNRQMARLFGYKRSEMIGRSTDILYKDGETATAIRRKIQQNPVWQCTDIEFRRRDGTLFWGAAALSVVTYDGQPCIIGTFYDTTAQRTAQILLHESEARIRGILANVPDAVFTLDVNGSIQSFNPAAERMFGYSVDEVHGLSFTLLMPEDVRIVQAQNLRRYRNAGEARYVGQGPRRVIAQHKNGTILALEISIGALSDSSGTILVAVARDVSERERTESELRAAKQRADIANRAKSAFIANISHELRTPLNAILGFSDIIRKQLLGTGTVDRYAEYANDIHTSGSHLLAIINDILDLSKIEAGQSVLDENEIELSTAIAASLRLVAERANQGGVQITTDIPAGMPRIRADQRKLKQILINLLSNAVKFTNPGGAVTVAARCCEGGVEIIVADNGIGMVPDDIPHALMPFTQLDGTLARKYEGTGLGLPLAKALAELHGGSIEIESAVGRGTTVHLRLPPSRILAAA
ncbi:MAG: PAS domain S-box protein [Alphaproteobacteria bacterium]